MKPLIVLLVATLLALIVLRLGKGVWDGQLAARIGMAAMLAFTAVGHFAFTKGMTMMLPNAVPFKEAVVYGTGVLEILAGMGLLIPATQHVSGWFLIAFFILLLPANIKAALDGVDYQKGTLDGPGTAYLWFRVPLQFLFIGWVWWSALRR